MDKPKLVPCHSCSAPLNVFKGASDIYCKYCSDETGKLKSYEDCREGVVHWLSSWQPNLDRVTGLVRAEHFMKAMPAWADRKA